MIGMNTTTKNCRMQILITHFVSVELVEGANISNFCKRRYIGCSWAAIEDQQLRSRGLDYS